MNRPVMACFFRMHRLSSEHPNGSFGVLLFTIFQPLSLFLLFLFVLVATPFSKISGQTQRVEFGKNRVQYHDDFEDWFEYESRNFITYFYGKGRRLTESVVMLAEQNFNQVQRLLEHRINEKIEILVYTDLTDLKQSNIGNEEAFTNTGGTTHIAGNKIFVYFDGDHNHLEVQIRQGIASIFLQSMLFGSNIQEIVQNAVLLHLPEWFEKGLVSFAGEVWNEELDNRLRDVMVNGVYEEFEDLADDDPAFAGHAMWYYIYQNFGRTTVSNVLYLTRINRSVESGFLFGMGLSRQQVADNWKAWFTERYLEEVEPLQPVEGTEIPVRNRRKLPMSQATLSPDGRYAAYVLNEIGRAKVWLHDLSSGKRQMVFKTGFRNAFQETDYTYPALSWSPDSKTLGILYERQDEIRFLRYSHETGKTERGLLPPQFQRVYSFQFLDAGRLVMSASTDGWSDLFLYRINTRQSTRLTRDVHDDLDPVGVRLRGRPGILFSSNRRDESLLQRPLDTLPTGTFDLFFLPLDTTVSSLIRVTNSPMTNERNPQWVDTTWFSFVTDWSGIRNRGFGYLDEVFSHFNQRIYFRDGTEVTIHQDSVLEGASDTSLVDSVRLEPVYRITGITHTATDYRTGVLGMSVASRPGVALQRFRMDGTDRLIVSPVDPQEKIIPHPTRFRGYLPAADNTIRTEPPAPPVENVKSRQDAQSNEVQRQTQKGVDEPSPPTSVRQDDAMPAVQPEMPAQRQDYPVISEGAGLTQDQIDDASQQDSALIREMLADSSSQTEPIRDSVTGEDPWLLAPGTSPASTPADTTPPAPEQDTTAVDIDNYLFQSQFDDERPKTDAPAESQPTYNFLSGFGDEKTNAPITGQPTRAPATVRDPRISPAEPLTDLQKLEQWALRPVRKVPEIEPFLPSRIIPSRLKFRMDYFTSQADNSLLFDGLDSYTGLRPEFDFMPAGLLLKGNFKDLMEDYELEGGVRVPLSFNGTEFFVVYNDKKKRIDKRYALYRRVLRNGQDFGNLPLRTREMTLIGLYQLRYPFDIFRSLRATGTFRLDETVQLSSDLATHEVPTDRTQRLGARLEYVFDNTLEVDLNILNGTRYKVTAEVVKRFGINFGGGDATFDLGEGVMTVIGFDGRHYQRFLKHSVIATRVAGATSFGAEKILYLLGGTENWLFPKFDETLNTPSPEQYGFQSLAANMRGFPQNIRNGSSWALVNAELRMPVFKYFSRRLRSNFLRHFQLVGFFDAGTAWQGANPFSDDNPLNTLEVPEPGTVPNALVRVKVNYFRDPVVMGYGVGLRTMLFGYFIRFDYARGIESRQVLDPRLHISLGTDF